MWRRAGLAGLCKCECACECAPMFCLHVHHIHAWCLWKPKEGVGFLETGVTIMSCHVGTGNGTQISGRAASVLNPRVNSLACFSFVLFLMMLGIKPKSSILRQVFYHWAISSSLQPLKKQNKTPHNARLPQFSSSQTQPHSESPRTIQKWILGGFLP